MNMEQLENYINYFWVLATAGPYLFGAGVWLKKSIETYTQNRVIKIRKLYRQYAKAEDRLLFNHSTTAKEREETRKSLKQYWGTKERVKARQEQFPKVIISKELFEDLAKNHPNSTELLNDFKIPVREGKTQPPPTNIYLNEIRLKFEEDPKSHDKLLTVYGPKNPGKSPAYFQIGYRSKEGFWDIGTGQCEVSDV